MSRASALFLCPENESQAIRAVSKRSKSGHVVLDGVFLNSEGLSDLRIGPSSGDERD